MPQPQDIFLIADPDPAVMLREWAGLTGMPHLPPLWSLGYQQSHRTLASRDEVLAEARTFREKKLPCDAMIYLGTGFAPSGWNTGHGSFAFNRKIFPDPEPMFHEMHDEGFRVILHVLGAPHDLHGEVADHSADPDDVANYWAQHREVFRTGIDGWWVDDGDELFPESRLARNRMYWDGPLAERPNLRPFSIQRNGYAGLQRYGFLWSGDTNSQWATLRAQIADGLNTGLSGIPYWGTDTGGFFSTRELSAELYVRWFQFSAFCPLFRSHGRTWKLRLPWGWNTGSVGPVEDDPSVLPSPDQLHNAEVETICRKYLELRYRLLPYTYSTVWQTHRTGMPVMHTLWLGAPGDQRALATDDAYLWGDALLVAPVSERGATERSVYLPRGLWYDFWTNGRIDGGTEVHARADLAALPLFVRAGSILPMGPVKQFTTQRVDAPLEVSIYPGADGEFTLYQDDGVSMDHLRGASSVIHFAWNDAQRRLTIRLGEGSRMGAYTSRSMVLRTIGTDRRTPIEFTGAEAVHQL
jgi:alpha-glucosidase/alpha-D-xyloside xylohydrolase